jgi:folate-binding protein YgfZ
VTPVADVDVQTEALEAGRAFVDLSAWRKVHLHGTDAAAWLNDLLSADLAGLSEGSSRRSLLLSPTGRVRAEVLVIAVEDGFLVLQDPVQDTPIADALRPYVLSSDVTLEDATDRFGILAFPGATPPAGSVGRWTTPSALGDGVDLVVPEDRLGEAAGAAGSAGLMEAGPEAVEGWRIRAGRPRVGVDVGEDTLPHEAALDSLIGYHKGCFLGQEAVAKVRNLGHPPFVLLAATAPTRLAPGDPIRSHGSDAGMVTSAATIDDVAWAAIVRVRWAVREAELESLDGTMLDVRGPVLAA